MCSKVFNRALLGPEASYGSHFRNKELKNVRIGGISGVRESKYIGRIGQGTRSYQPSVLLLGVEAAELRTPEHTVITVLTAQECYLPRLWYEDHLSDSKLQ